MTNFGDQEFCFGHVGFEILICSCQTVKGQMDIRIWSLRNTLVVEEKFGDQQQVEGIESHRIGCDL